MGYDKSIICPRRTPCPPGQSLHLHWSATGSWYPSWGELGRVLSGWFPALFKLCTVHFAIIIFNSCGTGGTVLYEAFVSQHHLIGDYNKAWQRIFSPGKTKYIAIYHFTPLAFFVSCKGRNWRTYLGAAENPQKNRILNKPVEFRISKQFLSGKASCN